MWRATVLTIFPEMFPGPLGMSLAGKALGAGLWALDTTDIRAYATDKHRTVDDTPAGGGPGMVMKADVLARAIDAVPADDRPRLLMSPRGAPLTQARVAAGDGPRRGDLCGRFEGVDERLIAARPRGGLGRRLRPVRRRGRGAGADRRLRPAYPRRDGKEESGTDESYSGGLLEYPQYTRPSIFEDRAIPDVLTGGDHAKVKAWRRAEAERLTRERRPDLWEAYQNGPKNPK